MLEIQLSPLSSNQGSCFILQITNYALVASHNAYCNDTNSTCSKICNKCAGFAKH
jgi:hypothetical protein